MLGIAFWSAWVEANEQQFAEVFCQRVNKTHKCILFEINQIYIINIILGTTSAQNNANAQVNLTMLVRILNSCCECAFLKYIMS